MKNSPGALHGIRSPDKAGATPASSRSHWVRVRAGAYGPKDRPSRQREIAAYPYPPWTRSYPLIRQMHDQGLLGPPRAGAAKPADLGKPPIWSSVRTRSTTCSRGRRIGGEGKGPEL